MELQETDPLAQLNLPPGFRFYPTDKELLVHYLCRKVAGHHFFLEIIGEIDLYKFDPWVLPSKAIFGEKEWYFFSPRDRKYPNGSRPNRVARSGYWKATGTDKVITIEGREVGIKKALVFYVGKAPKGTKTNWIMHEYRLLNSTPKHGSTKLDDWVLCRIYKKSSGVQKPMFSGSPVTSIRKECIINGESSSSSPPLDDVLDSLAEVNDHVFSNSWRNNQEKININTLDSGRFDWASVAGFNSVQELAPSVQGLTQGTSLIDTQDAYVRARCHLGNSTEGEVQNGIRRMQYRQHNAGAVPPNFVNPVNPFGFDQSDTGLGFGLRR